MIAMMTIVDLLRKLHHHDRAERTHQFTLILRQDEFVGGMTVRGLELLGHNFMEPWSQDYFLVDKNGQVSESCLK
jgi:hypothetical protein